MKSYKITESEKPLVEINHETPIPVGKQVLVKTIACGVCHSDIHIHDGFFDGGDGNKIPSRLQDNLTMGHEVYGELVSVGEEVRNVEIGKKYVIYPWIGCGECDQCEIRAVCGVRRRRRGRREQRHALRGERLAAKTDEKSDAIT